MPREPAVGGDVDAYCTRCKMDLAHTVCAMMEGRPVQVKCNTCDGFHRYRAPESGGFAGPSRRRDGRSRPSGGRSKRAAKSSAPPTEEMKGQWLDALAARAESKPRAYDVRATYGTEDVVDHPKFGKGAVIQVLSAGRMKVRFEDEERVLVMNYSR